MRRKSKASVIALCGVLAALGVCLLFLGGAVPIASITCPMLASLVLIPVYAETGERWGLLWFITTALLGILLTAEKEAAILFVFFGYYPILKRRIGHLPGKPLRWLVKLLYVNAATFAAYTLMIFVFRLEEVSAEFEKARTWMLAAMLLLANVSFILYDLLIDRLEIFYHVHIRPKLKL